MLSVCAVSNIDVLCPNGWMDQDETWHAGRPQPWPHCVRWGPSSPVFSPYLLWPNGWMDQNVTCKEVGLGPSDIVLDGDLAPPPQKGGRAWGRSSPSPIRGHSLPIFGPCLLWPNGCMDQDKTWHRGRPQPWPHCVRWGPSSPRKGAC